MTYRYLILTEDFELFGTNSEKDAKEANDWELVYDTQEGKTLDGDGVQPWEAPPDADDSEGEEE